LRDEKKWAFSYWILVFGGFVFIPFTFNKSLRPLLIRVILKVLPSGVDYIFQPQSQMGATNHSIPKDFPLSTWRYRHHSGFPLNQTSR